MNLDNYKKIIIGLGEYYSKPLSDLQIKMYAQDLSSLPEDQLLEAVRRYRTNPKNVFFPLPAQLIETINPQPDKLDEANEMCGAIIDAVRNYGATGIDEARESLGVIAWFAVERFGGWAGICETREDALPTIRAQLRDLCKMSMAVSKRSPDSVKLEYEKTGARRLGELSDMKRLDFKEER